MPRGPRSILEMTHRLLQEHGEAGWGYVFGTPDRVADWRVYGYEYVDDLNFMPPANELFRDWPPGEELLARVGDRLRKIGWDGEGVFQVFWLPPFLGIGIRNYGSYGLLVKQDNDGISFVASPVPLPWVEGWDTHPIYAEFARNQRAQDSSKPN